MASAVVRAGPAAFGYLARAEPPAVRAAAQHWQRVRGALPRLEVGGSPHRQWSSPVAAQRDLSATLARSFPRRVVPEAASRGQGGGGGIPPWVLLNLSLLGCVTAKAQTRPEIAPDHQVTRMEVLLAKDPSLRTADEKLELFNTLLSHGEEEAATAKGKDVVVVFGNTGAGKSTWINTVYGCTMMRNEMGDVVVDPASPVKEVARIGTDIDSCTYLPKQIPPITFEVPVEGADSNPMMDDIQSTSERCALTLYDMPGLADNRGIEVALANVIVLKEIVQQARSVRLVMVFEYGQIGTEKGAKWREAVKLLQEGFRGILGQGDHSLSLVITKDKGSLVGIKQEIRRFTGRGLPDLSEYATVYDPLDLARRQQALEGIHAIRSYRDLDNQVSMGETQLWEALQLGKKMAQKVEQEMGAGDPEALARALQKVQFTHGIAKLGNGGLGEPHEKVVAAVAKPVEALIMAIEANNSGKVENNQIAAFDNYKLYRQMFGPYVDFNKFDVRVNNVVEKVKDPRWFPADQGSTIFWRAGGTGALATAVSFIPVVGPFLAVGIAVGGGGSTLQAIGNWWNPSEKDKKISAFKEGVI